VSALLHTFAEGRDVDDAAMMVARFENGSLGTFEATRYATGCRNQNRFEMHGERGMVRFNLEDLNRLDFFDTADRRSERGPRSILVTGPEQPYAENYWKPGHLIGYEHTFIGALGDFLAAVAAGQPFHPDFEDGVRVARVLDAVERSARQRQWVAVD
jgi:predicted dehydrogenase